MSVLSMGRIVASRSVPTDTFPLDVSPPTPNELLTTIGAYIPTDVTTMYVPVAAGMVAADVSRHTRLDVAVGVSVFAAFTTWVIGHRAAAQRAAQKKEPAPRFWTTFVAGWYEILAAGGAQFVWATAMPDSWHDWGTKSVLWVPALLVAVASGAIGGLGALFNRPQKT